MSQMLHPIQFGHVSPMQLLDSSVNYGRSKAYGAMRYEAKKKGNRGEEVENSVRANKAYQRSRDVLRSDQPAEKFNMNLRKSNVGMGIMN